MNRLFVDALKSVGLVGAGDDPEATVMFWKSKTQDTPNEATKVSTSAESATVQLGEGMPDIDLSAIQDEDIRKSVAESIDEAFAGLESRIAELEQTEEPEVEKDLPEEVQAILTKEREEREELRKQLDEERAARRKTEFAKEAETVRYALGKPEEMATVLEEVERKAPEAYAKLKPALQTASNRVKAATEQGLFKEIGVGDEEVEADPIAKRDKFVAEYLKENSDSNEVEARRAFWKAHPEAKEELRS